MNEAIPNSCCVEGAGSSAREATWRVPVPPAYPSPPVIWRSVFSKRGYVMRPSAPRLPLSSCHLAFCLQQERLCDASRCPPPTPLLLSSGVLSSAREAMWCVPVPPAYPSPPVIWRSVFSKRGYVMRPGAPTPPRLINKWGYTCFSAPLPHIRTPSSGVLSSVSEVMRRVPLPPPHPYSSVKRSLFSKLYFFNCSCFPTPTPTPTPSAAIVSSVSEGWVS